MAEMKVLRAHFFFDLVRLFKKVPYFDENVETPDYVSIPNDKYSRDELLGMIANELLEAANMLPETQPEVGRIHKYVALAYAAKVKLYQAYKQDETTHKVVSVDKTLLGEVVSLVDQVLATERYDLLSDFQGLDIIANENGKESVFAVQYSMNDGSPSAGRINWSQLLNSPSGNSPYHGDGFFLPSQDLINAYQTDENGLPVFNYQSLPDFSVVKFIDDNTQILSNADHTVDPRLDFVIGRPGITWKTYTDTPCRSWVRDRETYGHNCVKRFWVSLSQATCTRAGLGEHHRSTGRLSALSTSFSGKPRLSSRQVMTLGQRATSSTRFAAALPAVLASRISTTTRSLPPTISSRNILPQDGHRTMRDRHSAPRHALRKHSKASVSSTSYAGVLPTK